MHAIYVHVVHVHEVHVHVVHAHVLHVDEVHVHVVHIHFVHVHVVHVYVVHVHIVHVNVLHVHVFKGTRNRQPLRPSGSGSPRMILATPSADKFVIWRDWMISVFWSNHPDPYLPAWVEQQKCR